MDRVERLSLPFNEPELAPGKTAELFGLISVRCRPLWFVLPSPEVERCELVSFLHPHDGEQMMKPGELWRFSRRCLEVDGFFRRIMPGFAADSVVTLKVRNSGAVPVAPLAFSLVLEPA